MPSQLGKKKKINQVDEVAPVTITSDKEKKSIRCEQCIRMKNKTGTTEFPS
jgi:hypothetical protein